MKKTALLSMLIFFFFSAFAKDKKPNTITDSLLIEVDSINYYLAIYDTLSPLVNYQNKNYSIDSVQDKIIDKLLTVLNNNLSCLYDIDTLFKNIQITTSGDKKVSFISIDEKTGGSFQSAISLVYCKLPNGMVLAQLVTCTDIENIYNLYFNNVHLIDSVTQTYYVEASTATCNTCLYFNALTFSIAQNIIDFDLIYTFDGSYFNLNVADYNPNTKIFTYEEHEEDNFTDITSPVLLKTVTKGKIKYMYNNFYHTERCSVLEQKK